MHRIVFRGPALHCAYIALSGPARLVHPSGTHFVVQTEQKRNTQWSVNFWKAVSGQRLLPGGGGGGECSAGP